ncbi:MAG TPA: HD domain-containing phosphohydrolase [Gemmataceae bacterium]|nr:HD domain-containing phosphohydrolase [Gemmataceae bacterium]
MTSGRIILTGTSDAISGRVWQSAGVLRVGRLPELEIVLDHSSVSRVHAEVTCEDRGWVVVDLGSTNGTFLNGIRVTRTGQPLSTGDVLQFGHLIMKVADVEVGGRDTLLLSGDRLTLKASITRSWEDAVQANASPDPRTAPPDRRLVIRHIGRDFYDVRSLDAYLEGVLWSAADALAAQYGAVLTWTPGASSPDLRAELACGREITRALWLKSRTVHAGMQMKQSQLYVDPRAEAPEGRPQARNNNPGSLICALLRSPRGPLGLLCLARTLDRKPFDQDDLAVADDLALAVSPTAESLDRLLDDKRDLLLKTLTALAQTIELRDESMRDHCQRVTDYALMLADELAVSPAERRLLQVGTALHEIGKIGVPDAVLQKDGSLSEEELDQLKSYPLKGAALVEAVPGLEDFLPIVRNHRERWDGQGYPDGLADEQIPLVARIVGVVTAFDAMTTDRPHVPAMAVKVALREIERGAGSQFDPKCVAAFLRLGPRIEERIRQRDECIRTHNAAEMKKTRQSIVLGV